MNMHAVRPSIADITRAVDAQDDAAAYDRKAMAMAFVLMIVRQRGDHIPNSFDMQNYDFFVQAGNNMASPPKGAVTPSEASTRLVEDDSHDPMMAGLIEAVTTLRANADGGTTMTAGNEEIR